MYYPDDGFLNRLKAWADVFSTLILISNGISTESLKQLHLYCAATTDSITLIQNVDNAGLAKALNQGLNHAIAQNFIWVVTFDQDTLVYPCMLKEFQTIYAHLPTKPVMLGSNYWHSALNKPFLAPGTNLPCVERKTLICSGTLMLAALPKRIGFFSRGLFY